jgi:hypothetical protein
MKKVLAFALVMGLAASAWAGGSCCASKKDGAAAKGGDTAMAQCDKVISSLNLSDEQKTKVTSIQEACEKEGKSKEACGKYMSQIREVLTPEQQAKWDEGLKSCEKPSDS